ncbi:MAG: hypothetical protein ACE364_11140 [Chlorobiota bacterium]
MKIWKILKWLLVSSIVFFLVVPLVINIIENLFPTKSNITHLLKEEDIALFDDFEIIRYRKEFTVFQESFSIKISDNDKKRIVNRLISSENFKENVDAMYDIRQEIPRFSNKHMIYTSSYKFGGVYGFQSFKTEDYGYAPDWIMIDIPENGNILNYDKFE